MRATFLRPSVFTATSGHPPGVPMQVKLPVSALLRDEITLQSPNIRMAATYARSSVILRRFPLLSTAQRNPTGILRPHFRLRIAARANGSSRTRVNIGERLSQAKRSLAKSEIGCFEAGEIYAKRNSELNLWKLIRADSKVAENMLELQLAQALAKASLTNDKIKAKHIIATSPAPEDIAQSRKLSQATAKIVQLVKEIYSAKNAALHMEQRARSEPEISSLVDEARSLYRAANSVEKRNRSLMVEAASGSGLDK